MILVFVGLGGGVVWNLSFPFFGVVVFVVALLVILFLGLRWFGLARLPHFFSGVWLCGVCVWWWWSCAYTGGGGGGRWSSSSSG